MLNLSVIGLGKLGACTAACFSAKGFNTLGIDINKEFVDSVNNHKAPVYEPHLQELIDKSGKNLSASQDYYKSISETDVTFLIVPTPSKADGNFSKSYLQSALTELAKAFAGINKKYHLFVIVSTVSPGTIDDSLIPLIESVSGKKLNTDFGICYNPEFIALGNVINNFLNPDMVLIGESDANSGNILTDIYKKVCENKPYFARMSVVSAEITKISLNSYVTMKISFANTLANICEKIPGADIDKITQAMGADRRISPYYLKGGLGFGGPCFPRDNRAFASFAEKFGYEAFLAKATDLVNEKQSEHIVDTILSYVEKNSLVAVLGLAYKANTPVIEESAAVKIIEKLLKEGINVIAYDPLAMENAKKYFGDKILYADSVKVCFKTSPVCVITNLSEEFKSIDKSYISKPVTIIDCWRMLSGVDLGENSKYIALGRTNE